MGVKRHSWVTRNAPRSVMIKLSVAQAVAPRPERISAPAEAVHIPARCNALLVKIQGTAAAYTTSAPSAIATNRVQRVVEMTSVRRALPWMNASR